MIGIRSGLGDHHHLAAGIVAVLGLVGPGQHTKLLDCVDRRTQRRSGDAGVIVVEAIERGVVGDLVRPRYVDSAAKAEGRAADGLIDTRHKEREIVEGAAIERRSLSA